MIRGKYLLQYIPPWVRYRKVNYWPNHKCFYYQGQVMWTQSIISHWWIQLRMALIIQCLFVIFIMWWPYVRMEQVNSRRRVVFLLSSPFPVASKNILNGILADFGRQTFNLKYWIKWYFSPMKLSFESNSMIRIPSCIVSLVKYLWFDLTFTVFLV